MEKGAVLEALKEAMEAPVVASTGPRGGCGRAYVVISGERAVVNAVSAACKKLGLMFLRKAYGVTGPCIYMGYDNANGRALAKAEKVAEVLSARGIKSYMDAVGD